MHHLGIMSTIYHAKYYAYDLSRNKRADSVDRFAVSLFDANVDLNPHQIDAAMFATRSPLSMGAILADEVGLGKTIEAGIVLSQYWAERKRRLLVICPASLRKQWSLELTEKFNIPTMVLDSILIKHSSKNAAIAFDSDAILVCSYDFANRYRTEVKAHQWDLVILDEAHKLRNAYRKTSRLGRNLHWALRDKRKILLTATPLQNSLMELYGLGSLIDEQIFGDIKSFRSQYLRRDADLKDLKARISNICKRTLRNQVTEYVRFKERKAITTPFRLTDAEHNFYEHLTDFIGREDTISIPKKQRHLMELVLRKQLSSSSHAIAGTLNTMRERLTRLLAGEQTTDRLIEDLIIDDDFESDYLEEPGIEWNSIGPLFEAIPEADDTEDVDYENDSDSGLDSLEADNTDSKAEPAVALDSLDRVAVAKEIKELTDFINRAQGFGIDTKSQALLHALEIGFLEMSKANSQRRAVIFTESRRTQSYLYKFLESNGYASKVILFNGANTEQPSQAIYEQWQKHSPTAERTTGSKSVDIRTALIDHFFRNQGEILLATEAAAEGLNLQFCSLVVNYDLPWNPQRIEQRIGRCHRYGQEQDVIVINFLNERNAADQRVLELLEEKLNLFSGVFGASDEILGAIESGLDFEKRIFQIYKQSRKPEEIDAAFATLQAEIDDGSKKRLLDTRRALLDQTEKDFSRRLKTLLEDSRVLVEQTSEKFWALSKIILREHAVFDDSEHRFRLDKFPRANINLGVYRLISKLRADAPGEFSYRISHSLGQHVLELGVSQDCPLAKLEFDLGSISKSCSELNQLEGAGGWLNLQLVSINSMEVEQYLVFTGSTHDGRVLDEKTCEMLFQCDARVMSADVESVPRTLSEGAKQAAEEIVKSSRDANNVLIEEEKVKLTRWANDRVIAAEKELDDIKERILALNRKSRQAETPAQQKILQGKIDELEKEKRKRRLGIFDRETEILGQKDKLINDLELRLAHQTSAETLFTIQWSAVRLENQNANAEAEQADFTLAGQANNFNSQGNQRSAPQLFFAPPYEGLKRSAPEVKEVPGPIEYIPTAGSDHTRIQRIEVRLKFDRDLFCRVSLIPWRTIGSPDEITAMTSFGEIGLVAIQENWYQDVTPPDLGKLLLEGTMWSDESIKVRWSLSGRELYVLAPQSGMTGYVSQPCLELGKNHCVLCTETIKDQVKAAIREAGARNFEECDASRGAPNGWVILRDITPTEPVRSSQELDIMNALRPIPNIDISLERGIRVEGMKWIEGFPPKIFVYGERAQINIEIDGKVAETTMDGSMSVEGFDKVGQHVIWCGGTSKSYTIVPFHSECQRWDAHTFSVTRSDDCISFCGPLVCMRKGKYGDLVTPILVSASNPLLLGPTPGDIAVALNVSGAKGMPCLAGPTFEPVWAFPMDPIHCSKENSNIQLLSAVQPKKLDVKVTNHGDSCDVSKWYQLILDAGRKGLAIKPDTANNKALFGSYKNLARRLWRISK